MLVLTLVGGFDGEIAAARHLASTGIHALRPAPGAVRALGDMLIPNDLPLRAEPATREQPTAVSNTDVTGLNHIAALLTMRRRSSIRPRQESAFNADCPNPSHRHSLAVRVARGWNLQIVSTRLLLTTWACQQNITIRQAAAGSQCFTMKLVSYVSGRLLHRRLKDGNPRMIPNLGVFASDREYLD